MSARTLPSAIYLSVRTGLPVERPDMVGWTDGDRLQWESDHATYQRLPAGLASVEAIVEAAIRGALHDAGEMIQESASHMSSLHEGGSKDLLHEHGDYVKGMVDECIDSFNKRQAVGK